MLVFIYLPTAESAEIGFDAEVLTLANGLQLVVLPDHRAPIVTHMIWYKVGAADDLPGRSGVAHLLEHLMFKGTREFPNGTFSELVMRRGGRENAFTTHDNTVYFQTIAREHLALVMRLEADRMHNLVLTLGDVAAEREVVLEERRQRTDNDPVALFGEHLAAAQFLSHPYGKPVIGWEHEIKDLTLADVEEFYELHYAPNNAILVIVGDVEINEVHSLAEKYYGHLSSRELTRRVRSQEPEQIAARRVKYSDHRLNEPSWRRTYLAPSYVSGSKEHSFALILLADILGGDSISRLYRALVIEARLAADVGVYYNPVSVDPNRFYIYVMPLPGVDLHMVEKTVERVIESIIEDGVSDQELKTSKSSLAATTTFSRDRISSTARILGSSISIGLTVLDVVMWPDRIEAVSSSDIKAAAQHIFDGGRSVTGILMPKPSS